MLNVTPIILCGGSVTCLWPLSRKGLSKQFLCLTGKESLFQQAVLRVVNLGNADIWIASPSSSPVKMTSSVLRTLSGTSANDPTP
jgi:mannose-1-phosphate guanylyltransferase/mannose-6-phosphate isomerase